MLSNISHRFFKTRLTIRNWALPVSENPYFPSSPLRISPPSQSFLVFCQTIFGFSPSSLLKSVNPRAESSSSNNRFTICSLVRCDKASKSFVNFSKSSSKAFSSLCNASCGQASAERGISIRMWSFSTSNSLSPIEVTKR